MARISAHDIEVIYPVVTQRGQSLRLKLMHYGSGGLLAQDTRGIVNVRALTGLHFDIREGDRVGLVGRNGAGKSTLLRVLAGIYHPSRGQLAIEGEVSAILGLGLGIDEELTGHETIDYALMMRGVPNGLIPGLHAEIADFTELEDYLQLPVRTYSSGMKIRLAFGVATARRPDILLLDEGIGAGDAFFLKKARERAQSFVDDASILVMASHSEDLLLRSCNKGLLLDRGQVVAAGPIADIIGLYQGIMSNTAAFVSQENERQFRHFISNRGNPDHDAANAFDGSVATHWFSGQQEKQPWIGEHFEQPMAIKSVNLRQWSDHLDNAGCVEKIAIEASDDDFDLDVKRIAVRTVTKGIKSETLGIETDVAATSWRVVGLATGDGPCESLAFISLEFTGEAVAEAAPVDEPSPSDSAGEAPQSSAPVIPASVIPAPAAGTTESAPRIIRHEMVEAAFARLAGGFPADPRWQVPPPSPSQTVALERRRAAISKIASPEDAIRISQMPELGFEARRPNLWLAARTDDIEDRLAIDFPQYSDKIPLFSDIPQSLPQFMTNYRGRLVSWPIYTVMRMIMRCAAHIPVLESVCQIGCGNGTAARLFAENPVATPKRMILIDTPEALFFADMLLRSRFGNEAVGYAESRAAYEDSRSKRFVLVPYSNVGAIIGERINLFLSLHGFQDMDAKWLQFAYQLVDDISPDHIYSMNYFATPLAHMRSASNFWTPRLSSKWRSELMLVNAHRAPRSFAEIIFSRRPEPLRREKSLARFDELERRAMSQQNFLEMLDCVRELPEAGLAGRLLKAVRARMGYIPGEAMVLYEILLANLNQKRQMTDQELIETLVWFSDSCQTYKIPGVVGFTEAIPTDAEHR